MRQEEYDRERMAYVKPSVTQKRDRIHKGTHSGEERFHEFVRLRMLFSSREPDRSDLRVYDIEAKQERRVRLRNMDAVFFLDDARRCATDRKLNDAIKNVNAADDMSDFFC